GSGDANPFEQRYVLRVSRWPGGAVKPTSLSGGVERALVRLPDGTLGHSAAELGTPAGPLNPALDRRCMGAGLTAEAVCEIMQMFSRPVFSGGSRLCLGHLRVPLPSYRRTMPSGSD